MITAGTFAANSVWTTASVGNGSAARTYSAIEVGIMQDIGYTAAPSPPDPLDMPLPARPFARHRTHGWILVLMGSLPGATSAVVVTPPRSDQIEGS